MNLGFLHYARREERPGDLELAISSVRLRLLEQAAQHYEAALREGGAMSPKECRRSGLRHAHALFLLGRHGEVRPALERWCGEEERPFHLSGFVALALVLAGEAEAGIQWASEQLARGEEDADSLWLLGEVHRKQDPQPAAARGAALTLADVGRARGRLLWPILLGTLLSGGSLGAIFMVLPGPKVYLLLPLVALLALAALLVSICLVAWLRAPFLERRRRRILPGQVVDNTTF